MEGTCFSFHWRSPILLILLLLVFVSAVPARGELPGLSIPVRDDHSAAIAVDSSGCPWVAWVSSFSDSSPGGARDALYVARHTGGSWDTTRVSGWEPVLHDPLLAADSAGVVLVWVDLNGTDSDLLLRRRESSWSDPIAVAAGPAAQFAPALVVDSRNRTWVAWQTDQNGSYDISLACYERDSLLGTWEVAGGPADDRSPSLAPGPDGEMWIAWSSIRNGHDELCLRRWSNGILEEPILLTSSERAWSSYPSAVVDGAGRVWVAYYHVNRPWEGFEGLGADPEDTGSIRMLVWDGIGVGIPHGTADPAGSVPRPTMEEVGYDIPGGSPIRAYGFRPRVLLDRENRLWVFSKLNGYFGEGEVLNRYWGLFGLYYQENGWSTVPEVILHRGAHLWPRPAVVEDGSGKLWVAWTRDRRDTEPCFMGMTIFGVDSDIVVDTVSASSGGAAGPPQPAELTPPPLWEEGEERSVPRYEMSRPGGGTYGVYWGENHRHTRDYSFDGTWDMTFEETFAYTYERIGYDWIATSDHVEWWSPLVWRMVRLWTDLYQRPERFITFPGYERKGYAALVGGSGHQDAIFRNGVDMNLLDVEVETGVCWLNYYGRLEGKDVILIPHHTADQILFTRWEDLRDRDTDTLRAPLRLVEIFQSMRGSSEHIGCPLEIWIPHTGPDSGWVHVALQDRFRIGFVAGGDHALGNGFTAVLAEEPTRESIFEALRARRCYGTSFSRKMFVDFRVNGQMMGDEIRAEDPPLISYKVVGTEPIVKITIIKNGDTGWFVRAPGTVADSASLIDPDPVIPGSTSWYYLRVEEGDSGVAWTSPIWVDFDDPTSVATPGPRRAGDSPLLAPLPFRPGAGPLRFTRLNRREPIRIYSSSGRVIRALLPDPDGAAFWDGRDRSGRDAPPGVYFYRCAADGNDPRRSGKIVIVR